MKNLKDIGLVILGSCFFMSCQKSGNIQALTSVTTLPTLTYRGADLSFLPEIEATGTTYYTTSNQPATAFSILQQGGMNIVRLRLWHTPTTSHSAYPEVAAMAQRVKAAGLAWLLDFHYSDTWADPGQQAVPSAWQGLSLPVLGDSVYAYTYRIMNDLKIKGILPAIVQIGNETNSGMLWDQGRVGGTFDTNWVAYTNLVKKGIAAIRAVDPSIKVMLHFAGTTGAQWYFNNMQAQAVNYDIIGLSYYYWWHNRTLPELQTDLDALATTFNKDIFIAETAYPFSIGWNDNTNNSVGSSSPLLPGYAATAAGQQQYLADLRVVIHNVKGGHGLGFCYWAPEWVAFKGPLATDGSAWENCTLFDFNNKVLPAISSMAQ